MPLWVLSSWSLRARGQPQMDHYGRVDVASSSLYKGYRYPMELISHYVWLYHRVPLSLREVEEMIMERGVIVSYETIRAWCRTFGQTSANGLRRRRPRPGDKWHLDEVLIKIQGKTHGIVNLFGSSCCRITHGHGWDGSVGPRYRVSGGRG